MNTLKRFAFLGLATLPLLLAAACDGGGGPAPTPTPTSAPEATPTPEPTPTPTPDGLLDLGGQVDDLRQKIAALETRVGSLEQRLPPPATGTLTGRVTRNTSQGRLSDVTAAAPGTSVVAQVGADGRFVLQQVPLGVWNVTVSATFHDTNGRVYRCILVLPSVTITAAGEVAEVPGVSDIMLGGYFPQNCTFEIQ